jgi:arylsulfatase A-like enzyme
MNTYEGGPRVPFLVQWKGRLPAGQTYDMPVMNLDVTPTILAATGHPIDAAAHLDGVDLVPVLSGKAEGRPHETMFWRFGQQWAVRNGDWKLVVSKGGSGRPELYDLAADVGEQQDHAASDPGRVAELQKLYDGWNAEQAEPTVRDSKPKKQERKKKQREEEKQRKKEQREKAAGAAAESAS